MSEPVSVQAAIAAIIRDMPAIGKDDKAPGNMGGFSYRGIEAMTRSIQPLLGQHGVVIIPQAGECAVVPAPGQNEAWQDVRIRFDWLIVGPDEPSPAHQIDRRASGGLPSPPPATETYGTIFQPGG